jgi:hypothetical protein
MNCHPAGNTSPSTNPLVDLLEPNMDVIMATWSQQMERNPMTLPPKNLQTLPSSIFVSYDFICWLMRSVANLNSLDAAIQFANKLVIEDRIRLLTTPHDPDNYGKIDSFFYSLNNHFSRNRIFQIFCRFWGASISLRIFSLLHCP